MNIVVSSICLLIAIDAVTSVNEGNSDSQVHHKHNSNINFNQNSNKTISHQTVFDGKLNHLVVDKNTGRVSHFLFLTF